MNDLEYALARWSYAIEIRPDEAYAALEKRHMEGELSYEEVMKQMKELEESHSKQVFEKYPHQSF